MTGGEEQAGLDVFGREVGEVLKDLRGRKIVSEHFEDVGGADTHTADAGASAALGGVLRDAREKRGTVGHSDDILVGRQEHGLAEEPLTRGTIRKTDGPVHLPTVPTSATDTVTRPLPRAGAGEPAATDKPQ